MISNLESAITSATATDGDFSMTQLYGAAWPILEQYFYRLVPELRIKLGEKHYKKFGQAILRHVFLIELVKVPKIETTKFRTRWFSQLNNDPRWCSFDECLSIAEDLITGLREWLNKPSHSQTLQLAFDCSLIPYEAPIDYINRFMDNGRIHTVGNVVWYYDELIIRTLKLRQYLTSSSSPDSSFFRTVLADKIKVKTYLTDRVLTGLHKTNREKRWETHPESVHFAERRTCMAIEYALVTEICAFDGFPLYVVRQLQERNILPAELSTALCPITGDALSYEAFRDELLNPTHGKSDFQVGHLNPLKLGSSDGDGAGHTADNISWISADGNRIQGSLSLNDVRVLLQRIADNYTTHNWWPNKA